MGQAITFSHPISYAHLVFGWPDQSRPKSGCKKEQCLVRWANRYCDANPQSWCNISMTKICFVFYSKFFSFPSKVFDILIFDILPENSNFNFQAVPPPPDPSSGLIPFPLVRRPPCNQHQTEEIRKWSESVERHLWAKHFTWILYMGGGSEILFLRQENLYCGGSEENITQR